MTRGQFLVEELNPFMILHLNATTGLPVIAYKIVKEIARTIGRQTCVLSEDVKGVNLFYP